MKGEVTITALADLAGLGAFERLPVTWTVPAGFAQAVPSSRVGFPLPSSQPDSADMKRTWLVVVVMLLALTVFLVSRKQTRR